MKHKQMRILSEGATHAFCESPDCFFVCKLQAICTTLRYRGMMHKTKDTSWELLETEAPKTLFEQVKSLPSLLDLCQQSQNRQALALLFNQGCPIELQGKCQIGIIKRGTLRVSVADASLATRLRYSVPQILAILHQQKEFSTILRVQITITQQHGFL